MEVEAALKRIASLLEKKWLQPYSRTCGYVNIRISITLVRATHQCIWGCTVTAKHISVQHPQWEDSTGVILFRLARLTTSTNGKHFALFYPTGILGRKALEYQNKKVGIRSQPVKRIRLVWEQ